MPDPNSPQLLAAINQFNREDKHAHNLRPAADQALAVYLADIKKCDTSSLPGKHSAHSRVVTGGANVFGGYGGNAAAGGRQGVPSMRSCRTSMAFLPCLRAVSM